MCGTETYVKHGRGSRGGIDCICAFQCAAQMSKVNVSLFSLQRDELGDFLSFTKGIAILFVLTHHFARSAWMCIGLEPPLLLQWHFIFPLDEYRIMYSVLLEGNYWEVLLRLVAHFGYFGFHLFILVSGLGLGLGVPEKMNFAAFIRHRVVKIVPPFWLAVIVFALLGWLAGHSYSISQVVARMLMLTTFSEADFFTIDSPLWCIALFLQLYVLFIPLRYLINRWGLACIPVFVVVSFVARQITSLPEIAHWNIYFGHVLALNWLGIFGLGIWIGERVRREGSVVLSTWVVTVLFVLAMGLTVLSDLSPSIYPIHDSAIGVFSGVVVFLVWRMSGHSVISRVCGVVGAVSFPLFLYHRPVIAQALNWWSAKTAATSIPPPYIALVLVVIILLVLLAQRMLRSTPKIAALLLGISPAEDKSRDKR
jgi:peptidoglycan/LPS O-acetylase OafA/YrhL